MNQTTSSKTVRTWHRAAAFFAALGAALAAAALAGPAALAAIPAHGGAPDGPKGQETFRPQVLIVHDGMPGWEIALIAVAAAALAATAAVLAYRWWTARRMASTGQPAAAAHQSQVPA